MIYLLGDVHGHFDHVIDIVKKDRPAAIIFLGDLDCPAPLHEILAPVKGMTEVWWIPGNHDTEDADCYHNLYDSEFADRNLHGRVVEIGGIRVAGLGGVFRGEIWFPPNVDVQHESYDAYLEWLTNRQPMRLHGSVSTSGKALKHRSSIFYRDWFNLYGQQADILVSHEAPHCHPHGFQEITALAQSLLCKFAFHGHHHDSLNYRTFDKEFGFQAFGVGYCGVTDMYGGRVAIGRQDEARAGRTEKK